nr:hypothetical protein [Angustibacter aerolatus]
MPNQDQVTRHAPIVPVGCGRVARGPPECWTPGPAARHAGPMATWDDVRAAALEPARGRGGRDARRTRVQGAGQEPGERPPAAAARPAGPRGGGGDAARRLGARGAGARPRGQGCAPRGAARRLLHHPALRRLRDRAGAARRPRPRRACPGCSPTRGCRSPRDGCSPSTPSLSGPVTG